mmetsp:Transcript_15155/g.48729  ORF Transcript_15155/g.48729 Transcript_15155/m.48729 type:complete len:224 (-) Transcript_15155:173-844(-)
MKTQHSRHTAPVDDIRDRGQPCSSSHQGSGRPSASTCPLSISEDSWRPRPQAPLEAAAADLSAASALSTQAGRGSEGRRAAPSASARRRSSPSSAPLMRNTSSCNRTVAACSCSETWLLHRAPPLRSAAGPHTTAEATPRAGGRSSEYGGIPSCPPVELHGRAAMGSSASRRYLPGVPTGAGSDPSSLQPQQRRMARGASSIAHSSERRCRPCTTTAPMEWHA